MKRKAIILLVWVIASILYCWNVADIGRSIGWTVNYAIETQAEFRHAENLGEAAASAFSYPEDLDSDFKFDFSVISITTVIYVAISIWCYHYGFAKKDKREGIEKKINNE